MFNTIGYSQKQANVWHLGYVEKAMSLDFSTGEVKKGFSKISVVEGSASYCDKNGKFLFYTDGGLEPSTGGGFIWNRDHEVMYQMSSSEGGGSSAPQSSVIFEAPNEADVYYIFTMEELERKTDKTRPNGGNGLCFFKVDMKLNGGLGGVADYKKVSSHPSYEALCAIRHSNGNDYWVLINAENGNGISVYSVTATGVKFYKFFSNTTTSRQYEAVIKASPDGKHVAHGFRLLDFNPVTGELSNPFTMSNYQYARDSRQTSYKFSEFSHNSKYIYSSIYIVNKNKDSISTKILRNLTADPSKIADTVGTLPPQLNIMGFQLANDGNIYFTYYKILSSNTGLGRITCPNSYFANIEIDILKLYEQNDGRGSLSCLTNFPAWLFKQEDTLQVDLGADSLRLCDYNGTYNLDAGNPGATYLWSNGATSQKITVNKAGIYTVTVRNKCESATDKIVVVDCLCNEILEMNIAPDTVRLCEYNGSYYLNAKNPGATYLWSTGETTQAIYISSPGIYNVKIQGTCSNSTIKIPVVECGLPCTSQIVYADTCLGADTKFNIVSNYKVNKVEWDFGAGITPIPISSENNTSYVYASVGTFQIKAIAELSCGKSAEKINLQIITCDTLSPNQCQLFFPKIFSPNLDRINDEFLILKPSTCLLEEFEILIYNRWGEIIFKAMSIEEHWNGMYFDKVSASGVYPYTVKYKFRSQLQKIIAGAIILTK